MSFPNQPSLDQQLREGTLTSRRAFLRRGACAALGTTGLLATLANLRLINSAIAQQSDMAGAGDYKALVCVFLYGGNDANNLLVPYDNEGYGNYANARSILSLSKNDLMPIAAGGVPGMLGLHPGVKELHELYGRGRLAFITNVGTLVAPITREQFLAGTVEAPPFLFSHTDQSVQWQTSRPDTQSRTGWGGRLADLMQGLNSNDKLSISVSLAGANTFQVGRSTTQYQVTKSGEIGINAVVSPTANITRRDALRGMLSLEREHLLELGYVDVLQRSVESSEALGKALAATPAPATGFPLTPLGEQLQMVSRLIQVGRSLGFRRQIFFAAMNGWDTHGPQLSAHNGLLGDLSKSLRAFHDGTERLGLADAVTTFTASDFGRTFTTNGQGSDHGWGNHHMVLGGAVRGGSVYGTFPRLVVNGPDDTGRGRWIPTTSVDEYSATLARWFGVAEADLSTVLPNIGRFARPDLGFMK